MLKVAMSPGKKSRCPTWHRPKLRPLLPRTKRVCLMPHEMRTRALIRDQISLMFLKRQALKLAYSETPKWSMRDGKLGRGVDVLLTRTRWFALAIRGRLLTFGWEVATEASSRRQCRGYFSTWVPLPYLVCLSWMRGSKCDELYSVQGSDVRFGRAAVVQ